MSLVTENYNYFEFSIALTKYMSEDNIPQKTLMSDAERKRLRRENETPEERIARSSGVSFHNQEKQRERQRSLRQAQSDQERGKFREYQRRQQASLRENETEAQTADRLDYKRMVYCLPYRGPKARVRTRGVRTPRSGASEAR